MTEETAVAETVDVEKVEAAVDAMRPEFLQEKFKSVEDQAKAYVDLSSEIGKKATEIGDLKQFKEAAAKIVGAPEEYEVPKSEAFEVSVDDPRFQAFKQFAKERNLSQGMFNEGLELFAQLDAAKAQADAEFMKAELSKLRDGENRIKNIQDWISVNLPDHAEGLADLATSAKGVEAIEALLEKAGKAPASPQEHTSTNIPSMEEIQAMQFAVDKDGNRKMRDPAYAAKVERLLALHVGKGEYQQFVG